MCSRWTTSRGRRRQHRFGIARQQFGPGGLDQRIERERAAGLALASAAVAAVHEQRRREQPEAHLAAGAAAGFGNERRLAGRRDAAGHG
jgi:hypothetical protein